MNKKLFILIVVVLIAAFVLLKRPSNQPQTVRLSKISATAEVAFSRGDVEVFATQGLLTHDFVAKPALAEWQTIFKHSFSP